MNNIYAFVVGIDTYDQPQWNVSGPCTNALAVTQWLLNVGVPSDHIFLFLEPKDATLHDVIQKAGAKGIHLNLSATWNILDSFWRTNLQCMGKAHPPSRLFFYWSGHGAMDKYNSRIFFCRDYTNDQLYNRVFNFSNVFRHLRAAGYQHFSEQIFLADVCGKTLDIRIGSEPSEEKHRVLSTKQLAFFASREGEYAYGSDGFGVFTDTTLDVLNKLEQWPNLETFSKDMVDAFDKIEGKIFQVTQLDSECERLHFVGTASESEEKVFVTSLCSLLSGIALPDSVYRPHYLRTVCDLGEPELNRAQGLIGMIRELASLRDAEGPSQVPYGLLQFLIRLCQEKDLATPISAWLTEHASKQSNALANVREKLENEHATKVLIIEVKNDENGKFATFQLFVRTHDLFPVPDINYPERSVKNWQEFCGNLCADLEDLQENHLITDFEIHFLVDPPLFDHAFHGIRVASGEALGEKYIVLLRYRSRVRSATKVMRKIWQDYADALRPHKPSALTLVPVYLLARRRESRIPTAKGLCYMTFIVQPPLESGSGISLEKQTLLKLLRMGVPYLYWLHSPPVSYELAAIESQFADWLKEISTLDQFPSIFTEKRIVGDEFAREATLLWDDPQFNPFRASRGGSIK